MITIQCHKCGINIRRSPSKVQPRNYCSYLCYSLIRNKEFAERGSNTRYKQGHKIPVKQRKILSERMKDDKHPSWKGSDVGYRGLHQWLRRKLGDPKTCSKCSKKGKNKRSIQWANIDGKYQRVLSDYIALCVSCHKFHDLKLKPRRTIKRPSDIGRK